MGLVIAILLVALFLGILGVVVEGLLWLLFVALIIAVAAFVVGRVRGATRGSGRTR
jgi:hypothetical protein